MPYPVSQSYDGPKDRVPFPPRWAYEHLGDLEYDRLKREHEARTSKPNPARNPERPPCSS